MSLFYRGKYCKSKSKRIKLFLTALCLVLLCISSFMLIRQHLQEKQEQDAFVELSELVEESMASETLTAENTPLDTTPTEPEKVTTLPQYTALYEQNSDFAGWLLLSGTEINLPVMYIPDDPEYYLRRAFDKTTSQSGTPFIGNNGSTDSDCFIIYGHNMKNNTMFGTLDNYKDADFWAEHKTFSFDTLYEHREYEVFAAMETQILRTEDTGFRYYNSSGELTEAQYKELTDWLALQSAYDTQITPSYGEQILILSTCSYHTDKGRFIVAARRIA